MLPAHAGAAVLGNNSSSRLSRSIQTIPVGSQRWARKKGFPYSIRTAPRFSHSIIPFAIKAKNMAILPFMAEEMKTVNVLLKLSTSPSHDRPIKREKRKAFVSMSTLQHSLSCTTAFSTFPFPRRVIFSSSKGSRGNATRP